MRAGTVVGRVHVRLQVGLEERVDACLKGVALAQRGSRDERDPNACGAGWLVSQDEGSQRTMEALTFEDNGPGFDDRAVRLDLEDRVTLATRQAGHQVQQLRAIHVILYKEKMTPKSVIEVSIVIKCVCMPHVICNQPNDQISPAPP